MSQTKIHKFVNICLVFTVLTFIFFVLRATTVVDANSGIMDSIDKKQIEDVILKSYEIEVSASNTFDTSSFASVFINDSRGGQLSQSTSAFIKSVSTINESSTNLGYLDYKLAYYNWWKQGALKYEMLQSKAAQEGRSVSKDELKTLIDEDGRLAMPRGQLVNQRIALRFLSVSIDGEVATVIFDDGPRTNQTTLVKIKDKWFIAGNIIKSVHP